MYRTADTEAGLWKPRVFQKFVPTNADEKNNREEADFAKKGQKRLKTIGFIYFAHDFRIHLNCCRMAVTC